MQTSFFNPNLACKMLLCKAVFAYFSRYNFLTTFFVEGCVKSNFCIWIIFQACSSKKILKETKLNVMIHKQFAKDLNF